MIAHKQGQLPYLDALHSKDEEVSLEEDEEKNAQTQTTSPKKPEQKPSEQADLNTSQESTTSKHSLDGTTKANETETEGQIDNPYLRTIKMPKFKGSGKRKW